GRHAAGPAGSAQGHASKYASQSWLWPALQRAQGRRRPDHLRARLQDGTRRHCVKAQGLDVSLRSLARLAQNEELGCTGGEARSRGGMGQKEIAMTGKNRVMPQCRSEP